MAPLHGLADAHIRATGGNVHDTRRSPGMPVALAQPLSAQTSRCKAGIPSNNARDCRTKQTPPRHPLSRRARLCGCHSGPAGGSAYDRCAPAPPTARAPRSCQHPPPSAAHGSVTTRPRVRPTRGVNNRKPTRWRARMPTRWRSSSNWPASRLVAPACRQSAAQSSVAAPCSQRAGLPAPPSPARALWRLHRSAKGEQRLAPWCSAHSGRPQAAC
mmetsp:Transcript_6043/g.15824  ORF Transcript_6043/g.15824 Transcript_6043/m.15824 type:complete len:215 (+) Transcript_6043:258-902(+)